MWGYAVAQLVEALRHKPEGRCHEFFMVLGSNRPLTEMSAVFTAPLQGEYKCGRCSGLTTLPPSCADCLKMWESQTPGNLRACPDLYRDTFTSIVINVHKYSYKVPGMLVRF
jgi:hypothetical protein